MRRTIATGNPDSEPVLPEPVLPGSASARGSGSGDPVRAGNPGDRLAAIARDLQPRSSSTATAERVTELARELVDGCDHAGVSRLERHGLTTVAASDEAVQAADHEQGLLGQGPCLESSRTRATIRSPRLATDRRWPAWAPFASRGLGFGSLLCFRLCTGERPYGYLTLYSDRPSGFDSDAEAVGLALASQAAVAIAGSRKIETLETALDSRTAIGQAEGILMERFGLTADKAFAVLVRVSQNENRRLALVAEDLVRTRRTPGLVRRVGDSDS